VRDQGGREVTVAQPVTRLASPYSLATYLAYGVGAGDRVVAAGFLGARDPDGIAAMTRIDPRFPDLVAFAGQETTNVEAIAALAWTWCSRRPAPSGSPRSSRSACPSWCSTASRRSS
jgi:ABC-type Fe3+-hydroxamate transport system substrate-binding protein